MYFINQLHSSTHVYVLNSAVWLTIYFIIFPCYFNSTFSIDKITDLIIVRLVFSPYSNFVGYAVQFVNFIGQVPYLNYM